METHSEAKKPGRYDCPACGERINKLIRKGTFFRPTSHCPKCDARISSDLLGIIFIIGLALQFAGGAIIEMAYKHEPIWAKVLFSVSALALLLVAVLNLLRIMIIGPYRLISGGTEKAAGGR